MTPPNFTFEFNGIIYHPRLDQDGNWLRFDVSLASDPDRIFNTPFILKNADGRTALARPQSDPDHFIVEEGTHSIIDG